MLDFFPFPQDNANKYCATGMSEQEQRMRWIAACRLDSINVTRHTRICSVHSDGGPRIRKCLPQEKKQDVKPELECN